MLTLVGIRNFCQALYKWKRENSPLVGNAATLVALRNISLTINIALSETVTEYSAVVRTQ